MGRQSKVSILTGRTSSGGYNLPTQEYDTFFYPLEPIFYYFFNLFFIRAHF